MPTSSPPPVPRTQAGLAPRSSAHCCISSWPVKGRLLAELRDPVAAVFDFDAPLRDLLLADFEVLDRDLLDALRLLLLPRELDFDFDFALAFVDRELLLLRLLRPELDGMLVLLLTSCDVSQHSADASQVRAIIRLGSE
jgi:hypothetical protein